MPTVELVSVVLSLFPSLSLYFIALSLLPPSMHSTSHQVPLLPPSELVASRQGGSKVLIGTMLTNGGRLEVAR